MSERAIEGTVTYRLVRLMKLHKSRAAAALSELGLHVGQEMVLVQLWAEDGLAQSELAERLGVTPPTVTKVVDGLEADGFLERRRDARDARVSRVHLTDRGRALREPVHECWRALEQKSLAGMTQAERLLLRRLVVQMVENLA